VQNADDITWVIENINDAANAALLNSNRVIYNELYEDLRNDAKDLPELLRSGFIDGDSGHIYTYFISDFVTNSRRIAETLSDASDARSALAAGEPNAMIGLSDTGEHFLRRMIQFLEDNVFCEPRVRSRKIMLETVIRACADLLYESDDTILSQIVDERAALEKWSPDRAIAKQLLNERVHRIQLAIDVLAEMGDQEIFDFVGIDAL